MNAVRPQLAASLLVPLLLAFGIDINAASDAGPPNAAIRTTLVALDAPAIERLEPNVLPLDELDSTYRFVIQETVPEQLSFTLSVTGRYTIVCNGTVLTPTATSLSHSSTFWICDLARVAQSGSNLIRLIPDRSASDHSLGPAFLRGRFSVKTTSNGCVVMPDRTLFLGPWSQQGHPFYSGQVAYRARFKIPNPSGRYLVALPSWHGSVAMVKVNGRVSDSIACEPWECDVTRSIVAGINSIEIVVIGAPKNAQPETRATGTAYGLFAPIFIKQISEGQQLPGPLHITDFMTL